MRNGEHPPLMLCHERTPLPLHIVDSHPRVEKKNSSWSTELGEIRSRRIQILKRKRPPRKACPSPCISTPWAKRRWEASPLLTIGSGSGLKNVLIVYSGLRSILDISKYRNSLQEGQESVSKGDEKHATGHCLASTRDDEVTFSPLKGTELGEAEWDDWSSGYTITSAYHVLWDKTFPDRLSQFEMGYILDAKCLLFT